MPKSEHKKIFVFLDTDKHASPFDILMIIDAFPDAAILKYESVTVEDAERIVYDVMFPRGPEGARHTKLFISGRDLDTAKQILGKARKCMFPPFELAMVIDPRGAYTTAAAAVAKTNALMLRKKLGRLEGKSVAILGGTGPVGQTAAELCASEKATVTVTSRSFEKAKAVAVRINKELECERVCGAEAKNDDEIGKIISQVDVVLSAGAAGARLLLLDVLRKSGKKHQIVVDTNAIPPLGVEGLDPNADGDEFLPSIFGIGALSVGKLKNKAEVELIRRAAEEPKGVFDHKVAYELAKEIASGKRKDVKGREGEAQKCWLP